MRWVSLTLLFTLFLNSLQAQSDLRSDLEQFQGKKLTEALRYLRSKDLVSVSYDPDAISRIEVPELNSAIPSAEVLIDLCLRDTEFELITVGDQLVIARIEGETESFTLIGVIRDKLSSETLPFASIAILGTNKSTTANSEGEYTILNVPSDTNRIAVSYIGYAPIEVEIGKVAALRGELNFDLTPRLKDLPSVQISARSQELLEIGEGVSQITFNPSQISKLPNLGENDVFAALRRLPGISGGQDSESGLRIRGGQTDQNLVMFDGISVYHVDHLFGFLSAFNSNVIKNIRVNKGGFDAKYGGRTSGLVEITGIDGNKLKPSLQAEATMLSVNVLAELPVIKEKASLVFGYRRAFTNLIQSPTYQNIFNNIFNSSLPNTPENNTDVFSGDNIPEYFFSDLNAKFNFKPTDKDVISLSYYQGQDDLSISFDGNLDDLSRITDDRTNWGNQGGSAKWSRKWGQRLYTYANYGISRYTSELEAQETFLAQADTFSQRFFEQRVNVDDNTFRLDNRLVLNSNWGLEFGWWNTVNEINSIAQDQSEILQDSTISATTNALYFQLDKKIEDLTIKGGLRTVLYSGNEEVYIEPRLSLTYNVSPNLQLMGAYGIYHQMIRRLNERSLYFSIPETWTLANENTIPVLESSHYILGGKIQLDDWTISLEGYHKFETGVVEFLFPEFGIPTGELSQFAIDGDRRVWGTDLLVKKSFGKHNFMGGYTFISSESRYASINQNRYFDSPGVSNHEFSFTYNLDYNRWDFSAAFVLANGVPFTPVLGTFIVTLPNGEEQQFVTIGGINSERVDWYHRLDVSAGYTIPLKNGILQLGLSVYNVYNNLAVKYLDYFRIPREDSEFYDLGQRDILSLGITPSAFLKLKL